MTHRILHFSNSHSILNHLDGGRCPPALKSFCSEISNGFKSDLCYLTAMHPPSYLTTLSLTFSSIKWE